MQAAGIDHPQGGQVARKGFRPRSVEDTARVEVNAHRIYMMASGILAANENISVSQAVLLTVRFVKLIEEIERFKREANHEANQPA